MELATCFSLHAAIGCSESHSAKNLARDSRSRSTRLGTANAATEGIGSVIAGWYPPIEVIGEGGMGSVCLAEPPNA